MSRIATRQGMMRLFSYCQIINVRNQNKEMKVSSVRETILQK